MKLWRRAVSALGLLLLLAACAVAPGSSRQQAVDSAVWHGRLALRLAAEPGAAPAQHLSAGFELSGSARQGQLTLLTPLGTTLAALSWSEQGASMQAQGEKRDFDSLAGLSQQVLGTEVPVAALFAWLRGEALEVAGWRADLSTWASGRITAQRTQPLPPAELRVVFDVEK